MRTDVLTQKPYAAPGIDFAGRWLDLSVPRVMGILNVTPDSFSDGGVLSSPDGSRFQVSLDKVLAAVDRMVAAGAAIIDVGGESTRPGAPAVPEQEELDRVVPVVDAIKKHFDVFISVDTSSPAVISHVAAAGAGMINDVRALQRPGALQAVADTPLAVCLMHMRGDPQSMQQKPQYEDVVAEVGEFLRARAEACIGAGIESSRLSLDPGFGFGKSVEHNYQLLARLSAIRELGLPVLIGLSRKSMIGAVTGQPLAARVAGSVAGAVLAAAAGARIIRVHDVSETVDAMKVVSAMLSCGDGSPGTFAG